MDVWEGILLLDASSLIAFAEEAGRPELIQELARRANGVEIPSTALDELADPDLRASIEEFQGVSIFKAKFLKYYASLFDRYPMLGGGELGVIARGISMAEAGITCFCVLDDRDARTIARRRGLGLTGTIGLLLELEEVGVIDRPEHLKIIARLRARGFRYDWVIHPLVRNDQQ